VDFESRRTAGAEAEAGAESGTIIEYPQLFGVWIMKSGKGLGIDMAIKGNEQAIFIHRVWPLGDVYDWNEVHKDEQVKPGGRIVKINSVKGSMQLTDDIRRSKDLMLTIQPRGQEEASEQEKEDEWSDRMAREAHRELKKYQRRRRLKRTSR
jgi:hypothetical protein